MVENTEQCFIKSFKKYLPFVFGLNIIKEQEIIDLLHWYESEVPDHQDNGHYQCFYDWVVSAAGEKKKSEAFLRFYNKVLSDLLFLFGNTFPSEIIKKIRDSILTKQESYLDSLGELLLFWHLLKEYNNKFEFLGVDFDFGNGRNCDIAFKDGNCIQLIEVSNLHNLINKDIEETIKKRIKGKLSDKTKELQQVQKYFSTNYPNCDVTLSILLFIWEEYVDLANQTFNSDKLKDELGDDFLPPQTILCQEDNDNFLWDICPLEEAINRSKEVFEVKSQETTNEIISRRGFFKKAAGTLLPMFGAIALSNLPLISHAIDLNSTSIPMNCKNSCSGSCSGDCSGSCDTSCSGGCGSACSGYCDNSCGRGCNSSCRSSCDNSCKAYCRDGCTSCKGACNDMCTGECKNACYYICKETCGFYCKKGCTIACKGTCESMCDGECKGQCGSGCMRDCSNGCIQICAATCTMGCGSSCRYGCSSLSL